MATFYSWNVNGLRAAAKKGFLDWLHQTQPDILGLQETRVHPDELPVSLRQPEGYHTYWAISERKGYSGVALYSRERPLLVETGLGIPEFDREGRTVIAHYPDFVFITAYFPNGGRDLLRVPFKMAYGDAFLAKCQQLRAEGKVVIFCGDVNTSHKPIDLARPRENRNHTGFLPEECAWMDALVEAGYVDSFRTLYPEQTGAYTWWAQYGGARQRNTGWRLDYFFVAEEGRGRIAAAAIHPYVLGSDHCPVSLTYQRGL
ncbi:MAG: exodeoxyribonuclease III [Anaerolineae bacterium]|nr:exodeoxyribonuclease III [Anaerolineae bacterium]